MIFFRNPGLIDLAAATTLGVHVKEGESPIGHFGTGLKFAVSTLLRAGCSVTIWRGMDEHKFGTERVTIRGEDFDMVTMDGQRLGFTTQLGRQWEPWMAYRELVSNAKDEGGDAFRWNDEDVPMADGFTCISVGGDAIEQVWLNRQTVMLESTPLAVTPYGEVHAGNSQHVFYRGVRIFSHRPTAFTYNLKGHLQLTEDRTAASLYEVETMLEKLVGALEDKALLRRILTTSEGYWEGHMNTPQYGDPQEAFREVARGLAMGNAQEIFANRHAVEFARSAAVMDMEPGDSLQLDSVRQQMLDRAMAMLKAGGFDISRHPLVVTETLGPGIMGMAKDGKLFLSAKPFEKGTREVAATLLEEYAHLESGCSDCTRPFQNYLLDQLLLAAERSAGAPF